MLQAITDLWSSTTPEGRSYAAVALVSLIVGLLTIWTRLARANVVSFDGKVPQFFKGLPLVGAWQFWSQRYDFHSANTSLSHTGSFSYKVGRKNVIGVSGHEARKWYFDSRQLHMGEGYEELFAGEPPRPDSLQPDSTSGEWDKYFSKRIIAMMKRDKFVNTLDVLAGDVRLRMDELSGQSDNVIDPFGIVYETVFQMTMRTVGAAEIAEDRKLLNDTRKRFEAVEAANSPYAIIFPWLPTPGKLMRLYGGTRIYMTFDKIIKSRKAKGITRDDPLQYLIDSGDDVMSIIRFVIGSLFAGQINTGIISAWSITHLATHPIWREAAYNELLRAVNHHSPETGDLPLRERLSSVSLDAWESDFPIADACLNESIRLHMPGTTFRKNTTGAPMPIPSDKGAGAEVIPPSYIVTYAVADAHLDPTMYPEPTSWNPGRWVEAADGSRATGPDSVHTRSEGIKYPYLGWGQGRHPCLGMRFAKLESVLLTAYFLAYFEFELLSEQPTLDFNLLQSSRPKEEVRVRFEKR